MNTYKVTMKDGAEYPVKEKTADDAVAKARLVAMETLVGWPLHACEMYNAITVVSVDLLET